MTPSPQNWLSQLANLTITPNAPARWNNSVGYPANSRPSA